MLHHVAGDGGERGAFVGQLLGQFRIAAGVRFMIERCNLFDQFRAFGRGRDRDQLAEIQCDRRTLARFEKRWVVDRVGAL